MLIEITEVRFKNFMSYQEEAVFKPTAGVSLISGKNGLGKCQTKLTKIDIEFEDDETKIKFLEFMNARS